ncbi:MAG: NUDIX hydrolase [Candidatus Omnitrophota bacterium]
MSSVILSTLCYIRRHGKTLMLFRGKRRGDVHRGKWNGLGGKFRRGETPEACVMREVFEESGLRIKAPKLRGVMTFPSFQAGQDWIVFLFTTGRFSGRMRPCPEGELAWVPDRRLFRLPLWEGDRYFLAWIRKPVFFSAKFVYRRGKLKSHQVAFYRTDEVF